VIFVCSFRGGTGTGISAGKLLVQRSVAPSPTWRRISQEPNAQRALKKSAQKFHVESAGGHSDRTWGTDAKRIIPSSPWR